MLDSTDKEHLLHCRQPYWMVLLKTFLNVGEIKYFRVLLLSILFQDLQQQRHLVACYKCRISDILSQSYWVRICIGTRFQMTCVHMQGWNSLPWRSPVSATSLWCSQGFLLHTRSLGRGLKNCGYLALPAWVSDVFVLECGLGAGSFKSSADRVEKHCFRNKVGRKAMDIDLQIEAHWFSWLQVQCSFFCSV